MESPCKRVSFPSSENLYCKTIPMVDSTWSQRELLPKLEESFQNASTTAEPILRIISTRRGVPKKSSTYGCNTSFSPRIVSLTPGLLMSEEAPCQFNNVTVDTPGPTAYNLAEYRPNREHTAPSFTFGRRCWPEKSEVAGRTSWQKSWFSNENVWFHKVDFHSENSWPSPSSYEASNFLEKQSTLPQSRGTKFAPLGVVSINKKEIFQPPAANKYKPEIAMRHTKLSASAFTHQFRNHGTKPWAQPENSPSPTAYFPCLNTSRPNHPSVKIRQISTQRNPLYTLGPFSAF